MQLVAVNGRNLTRSSLPQAKEELKMAQGTVRLGLRRRYDGKPVVSSSSGANSSSSGKKEAETVGGGDKKEANSSSSGGGKKEAETVVLSPPALGSRAQVTLVVRNATQQS